MERFTVVREVNLPPEVAWARVTEWERHGDHVPLTRVRVTADGFNARTHLGPFGFDDPMTIDEWDPPHRCHIVKTGKVIRGEATLTVEATDQGSRVTWTEAAKVRGLPARLDPLVARSGQRLFGRLVDRLLHN